MTENFCIPITAIALRVQLESEILIELFELQRKIFADNILTDEGGGGGTYFLPPGGSTGGVGETVQQLRLWS
jgi:hypothetical protein